jgi:myo-inositol-1(or 4)-monophosphatase
MKDIIEVGIEAAKEAGVFLLKNFGKVEYIESKGDRNLTTNLDREAERMIVDKIKVRFPEHGIFAEESGKQETDRDYLWIIDPLDGTHNYIRKINIFGTSIGVIHKSEFIAGFIYMPLDDELYVGEKGNGSYKNGVKISVSNKDDLSDCSVSFDSSIRYSLDAMLATLRDLSKDAFNIRMLGSSVRVLSYIAEGRLDGSIEFHDAPWDFAGGVCIIEEAGGKITNLEGGHLTYDTVGYIASNGIIHEKLNSFVRLKV